MNNKRRTIILLIFTFVIFLLALLAESVYLSDFEYRYRARRFNRVLGAKEKIMEDCLKRLKLIGEPHGSAAEKDLFSVAEENNITILEYFDDNLVYWSDNDFDVPPVIDDSLFTKSIIFLQNGWFVPGTIESTNEKIVGLLRVRTDYGFENNIIKNGFVKDFRIPDDVEFTTGQDSSGYNVVNNNGTFLFSLIFPEVKSNSILIIIPLIFWTSFFILAVLLTFLLVKFMAERGKNITGIFFSLLIFIILYSIVLISGKPEVVMRTGLFSPYNFSLNGAIPSLGHLLIISILAAVLVYLFKLYFPAEIRVKENQASKYLFLTFMLIAGACLISLLQLIFSQLVSDSNISFETYKVLNLSFFSLAGFSSIILLLTVPVLFLLKTFRMAGQPGSKTVIIPAFTSLAVFAAFFYKDPVSLLSTSILFLSIIAILLYSQKGKTGLFGILILLCLSLSVYSVIQITVYSEKKTTEQIKIQTLSFSTDNDPEAEHLLLDIWPMITGDTLLKKMMNVDLFWKDDADAINAYLNDTYFGGYWGNYNFSIVLCRNDDSLLVALENEYYENCFGFFDERIRKYGQQLTGTGFHFIDNQGGRSYYLGKLLFGQDSGFTNGLYIELYSNVNVFQQGYSELLLDKKFRGYSELKDYSFAKYINGEIVLKYGEFAYNKADDNYVDKDSEYRIFNSEGFRHIAYRNGNATVVISRPEITIRDIVVSFAYLFAFIFIFVNLIMMMIRPPALRSLQNLNFRQKLQMSFIGILLFSFILVGIVVTVFTIRQFRTKHNENIKEKMNSVYTELDNNLSNEDQLSADWNNNANSSLNELLINLSNILITDINLYDLNGLMMATSRPEIFYRNLTSLRMNNLAFINLKDLTKSEYIQTESIGSLRYISAYVPFYNAEGKVLTYVNLPYFRMQSLLARDISNLVVAVINFTLLLILITMSFAVFISDRLTTPLAMLGEGLASVKLGKKTEHLIYKDNDEIGELVKQYNRMVDEIEESADKLANSEREYAWREMAKQIAHEIKNPLTPMKLNVQQLVKSWKDGVPGFEKKLQNFSRNQIEYIETLSSIASAFSSFAKMPGSKPGLVNLIEQIQTTLELFRNTANVTFWVRWPHESEVIIYADKEHLNGIFSNLFKNSIQAIPPDRQGLVKVSLEISGSKVVVAVADNGTGIPESLQQKLFTPNFTTKSSGTGLGLSIAKKYAEGANGRIWFESEAEKGTTFYIEFPLMYTVEKPGETPKV